MLGIFKPKKTRNISHCRNLYSKRWEKWVDSDFVPEDNKKELIKICGHYVFSDDEFLNIKPNIDEKIKNKIKDKLRSLSEI